MLTLDAWLALRAAAKPGLLFQQWKREWLRGLPDGSVAQTRRLKEPRFKPGDVLYLREPLEWHSGSDESHYADGGSLVPDVKWSWDNMRLSAMHMPRAAARLLLRVDAVRRERLSSLSVPDAYAEGIQLREIDMTINECECYWDECYWPGSDARYGCPLRAYRALWDSINPQAPASSNPEVTVYTFTTIRRPEA